MITSHFPQGGGNPNGNATILFYDWDDTLLGSLVVPRKTDVRAVVNAHVRDTFIHPDLRNQTTEQLASIARTDTYRGTFPHDTPGEAEFTGTAVEGGELYPLTYKLDYAFMRKVFARDEANNCFTMSAASDTAYPFIHGWALTMPETLEDTWTTMRAGEFKGYTNTDPTADTYGKIPLEKAPWFAFADFSSVDAEMLCVKAVYEPGLMLPDMTSVDIKAIWYTQFRFSTTGIITYRYRRVQSAKGANHIRVPRLSVIKMSDIDGANSTFSEAILPHGDTFQFDVVADGSSFCAEVTIVEAWESNTMSGAQRGYVEDILSMVKFDHEKYDPTAPESDALGLDGTLFRRSIGYILECLSGGNGSYVHEFNYQDLNLKFNSSGDPIDVFRANLVNVGLAAIVPQAIEQGMVDKRGYVKLSWHQLQYAIINKALVDDETAKAENYPWYRGGTFPVYDG